MIVHSKNAAVTRGIAVGLLLVLVTALIAVPNSAGARQDSASRRGKPGSPAARVDRLPSVPSNSVVPGELLVRFKQGVDADERAALRREHSLDSKRKLPVPRLELVRLPKGSSVRSTARDLEQEPEVLYAEPNFVYRFNGTPNDPRFGEMWGLDNTGQAVNGAAPGTPDADIDAPEAWDTTTGSPGVTVAVVDSGVAYDHPDLSPNIWTNPGETGGGKESNGNDDDGNGQVDDWRGWDFFSNDNDPRDFNGHGSHVAGTIGARGNNSQGVAGVNSQVAIMPLRNGHSAPNAAASVSAFNYAATKGAKVVSASFSGPFSQALLDAINGAPNTLFVAAAGNQNNNNDTSPRYPCSYPAPNLICVAATDQNDSLAGFSNYGATSVDLAAPGTNILSTQPAYAPVFSEGFESDIGATWTTGGTNNSWARTSEQAKTGSFSLADSPGGNYLNGTNSFARTTNAINLSGKSGCRLDYQLRLATEFGYDGLLVEASTDAASWTIIDGWTGSTGGSFLAFTSHLSAFDGQANVYIRFRLQTDFIVTDDGAHVDDVAVRCLTSTYDGDEFAFFNGTSMATPHVSGVAALAWADDPGASVAQVRERLLAGVDPKPSLAGKTVTGGRLNAQKVVDSAPPAPPPPPPGPGPGPGGPGPGGPGPGGPGSGGPGSGGPGSGGPGPGPHDDETPPGPQQLSLTARSVESLGSALKRGLQVGIACPRACTAASTLLLARGGVHKQARTVVGRGSTRLAQAGEATYVVKVLAKAKKKLKRARSVKLTLITKVTGADGSPLNTITRKIKLVRRARANRPPSFPSPVRYAISTRFEYDAAGRLSGAVTTITIATPPTDPEGDPLSYKWTASNGSIQGHGLSASWRRSLDVGETRAGSVVLTVSDGRGGSDTFTFEFERGAKRARGTVGPDRIARREGGGSA